MDCGDAVGPPCTLVKKPELPRGAAESQGLIKRLQVLSNQNPRTGPSTLWGGQFQTADENPWETESSWKLRIVVFLQGDGGGGGGWVGIEGSSGRLGWLWKLWSCPAFLSPTPTPKHTHSYRGMTIVCWATSITTRPLKFKELKS